jgi:hypothetical protein
LGFPDPPVGNRPGLSTYLQSERTIKNLNAPFKRGDLFEIILIQIKGGGAKRPNKSEIKWLRDVAKYYNARDVVLAEWVKGNQLKFNWLVNYRADPKKAWREVDPGVLFR